jgi:hypothetical protein
MACRKAGHRVKQLTDRLRCIRPYCLQKIVERYFACWQNTISPPPGEASIVCITLIGQTQTGPTILDHLFHAYLRPNFEEIR